MGGLWRQPRRKRSFATRQKPSRAGVHPHGARRSGSGDTRPQEEGALTLTLFRNPATRHTKKQDVRSDLTHLVSEAGYHRSLIRAAGEEEGKEWRRWPGQWTERMGSAGVFGARALFLQVGEAGSRIRGESSEQERRWDGMLARRQGRKTQIQGQAEGHLHRHVEPGSEQGAGRWGQAAAHRSPHWWEGVAHRRWGVQGWGSY